MAEHANLYNLVNIQPLELNTTGLNETDQIVNTIFGITQNTVGDAWFIVSIWAMFIFLNWLMYRREENFGYDISRSMLLSSGVCFFISVAFLLSGWIFTVYPIIWFSTIVFISFIGVYALKLKNR